MNNCPTCKKVLECPRCGFPIDEPDENTAIATLSFHFFDHSREDVSYTLALQTFKIQKVLEYLEHGELAAVPASAIDAKIKFHNEELMVEMNLGENQSEVVTSQLVAKLGLLKGLKKEAKLPPYAAAIQEIKSSLGHEYYT